MLDDSQLKDLAKRMRFPLEGVYFKDELPRKLKYNCGYIINLDDSVDEKGEPNEGTHWTCLQVNRYPSGKIEPIFFDPYGAPPSESIRDWIKNNCGKFLPHTKKDVQSLMNNACGWYCCALLHFINTYENRSKDLYADVEMFLSMFDDLNESIDWKKNEHFLRMFFQPEDPKLRKQIDVLADTKSIMGDDHPGGGDIMKIPVDMKMMK